MALRAAGTFRWRGGTVGSLNAYETPGNWVNEAGAAWTNAYPGYDTDEAGGTNVNGDTVLFDQAVTDACAGYANARGALAMFKVYSVYDKDIGSLAAPLTICTAATGEVIIDGVAAGDIYLAGGGGGITKITALNIKDGERLYLTGALANINLMKATATIQAGASISTGLNIGYITSRTGDVVLAITAGATLPAVVDANGGTVTNNADATEVRLNGGMWTNVVGDIGELVTYAGKFTWTDGDITVGILNGGEVDGSQSSAARVMTDCYFSKGAKLNINNHLDNISIPNLHMQTSDCSGLILTPGKKLAI